MLSVGVFAGLAGSRVIESELRKRGLSVSTVRTAADSARPDPSSRVALAGLEALFNDCDQGRERPDRWPGSTIVVAPGASSATVVGLLKRGSLDVITDSEPRLIAARAAALVRRLPPDAFEAQMVLRWGAVRVDLRQRTVARPGGVFALHRPEYDLLACLARSGGAVCTAGQLTAAAWPDGGGEARKRLRTYMHHLRRKLEQDPSRPEILLTVHGRGYRLRPADAADASVGVHTASAS